MRIQLVSVTRAVNNLKDAINTLLRPTPTSPSFSPSKRVSSSVSCLRVS